VIAAVKQLLDTPIEAHGTLTDVAVILNGIERFEFVVLLFHWSAALFH
jgi:hypothetical protein